MAKKTRSRKIKFRSKLEEFCYNELLKAGIPFQYEPERITLIPGFVYEGYCLEKVGKVLKDTNGRKQQNITYTPDFIGEDWIIETKGFERPIFVLKWKLFKLYLKQRGLKYDLYKPHTRTEVLHCIEIIKQKTSNGTS